MQTTMSFMFISAAKCHSSRLPARESPCQIVALPTMQKCSGWICPLSQAVLCLRHSAVENSDNPRGLLSVWQYNIEVVLLVGMNVVMSVIGEIIAAANMPIKHYYHNVKGNTQTGIVGIMSHNYIPLICVQCQHLALFNIIWNNELNISWGRFEEVGGRGSVLFNR